MKDPNEPMTTRTGMHDGTADVGRQGRTVA